MRKTNNKQRKGFTIVELVIVIAVIAILAGVMIPTFGGIIETANRSADTQLVAQINTILTVQDILTGGVNDAVEIQKFVEENGLKLETKSKGSLLLYDKSSRRVVLGTLVEGSDEVIITDPSAGTVAKVIISGDRPVLLSDGSGNGAAVVVNNKNDSSNTAKFRQGITLLDEFIEGYLNITKKSRDGLAQAICDIRDATDWDDITKENGLLSKITKINPTLGNNLATYMSQVAIITTGEEIISSGNLASAKYLLVNSGVTKITQTIVDKLEDCENISIIDFSSNITEIESEDVFEALDDLGKKISINNEEIKKLDDEKDPNSTNNIFHVSARDLHCEKLVLVHRIDGTNIGTGEKIAEYGKDVVDYPVNLPYQVYPCTTANKAYKFKGYSFYEDGSNSIQYGATDYPLSEQQRAMAVGGQLTIYAIYEQVDADFMVGTSYYESAGMTYKLSKGAITSGNTITVISTDATLDASLIGLANAELTIPENVELLLPYKSDFAKADWTITAGNATKGTTYNEQGTKYNANNYAKDATYDKGSMTGVTNLTVESNVVLKIESGASIYVDAACYNDATFYQCYITNNCGVLVLKEGSKIVSAGDITAYGVIRGDGTITTNGGTVTELMTLYDWYGGTNASKAVGISGYGGKDVVPFNEWKIESILVSEMTLNYPTQYRTQSGITYTTKKYGLWGDDVINVVSIDGFVLAGPASASPVFVTYDATEDTKATVIKRSVSNDGDMKFTIAEGKVVDKAKELTIKVSIGSAIVNFANTSLPISHMDIIVASNAELKVSGNVYKVMPGSSITVEEDANLNVGTKVVVCNTFNRVNATDATASIPHAQYTVTKSPAVVVVNGQLNFAAGSAFAGEITSTKSYATITIAEGVTVGGHSFPEGYWSGGQLDGSWVTTSVKYTDSNGKEVKLHSKAFINGEEQSLSGTYTSAVSGVGDNTVVTWN